MESFIQCMLCLLSPSFLSISEDLTFSDSWQLPLVMQITRVIGPMLFSFHIFIWSSKVSFRRVILVKTKDCLFPTIFGAFKLDFPPNSHLGIWKIKLIHSFLLLTSNLQASSNICCKLDTGHLEEMCTTMRVWSDTQPWIDDGNHFQNYVSK